MSFQLIKSRLLNLSLLLASFYLPIAAAGSRNNHPITLQMVLKSVDAYYPEILAARLQVQQAKGEYLSSCGAFDPVLNSQEKSQPVGGYINNYTDTEVNVPLITNGIQVYAGYRSGRGNWPVYYRNFLTNSGGEYRAGISMPLLRGRAIDEPRTQNFIHLETIALSNDNVSAIKLRVFQEAIQSYWTWMSVGSQLQIFEDLLTLANTRHRAIIKQVQSGDLPQLAITENEQFILQRTKLLNEANMKFAQASNDLSLYYRDQHGKPLFITHSELPKLQSPQRSEDFNATTKGLCNHPEVRKMDKLLQIARLKRTLAQNDIMPYLNATAVTTKQMGSDGDPLLIRQAVLVGLEFKLPINQRQARGRLIAAINQLEQIAVQKKFLLQTLDTELKNLLITYKTMVAQVHITQREFTYARRLREAEFKKFLAGDSTLFLVNQREQLEAEVQLNLTDAIVNASRAKYLIKYFFSHSFEEL